LGPTFRDKGHWHTWPHTHTNHHWVSSRYQVLPCKVRSLHCGDNRWSIHANVVQTCVDHSVPWQ
jgi:hypothetical protein